MEWLFWVFLIGAAVWMVWMMTFRTEQWLRLVEADRRHKRENRAGIMKAGGLALKLFSRFR